VTFEYRLANVEEDIQNVEELVELVGESFKGEKPSAQEVAIEIHRARWGWAHLPAPSHHKTSDRDRTMNDKYKLTLSSFPKTVVYQAAGNIMAHPTPSGEPAVLAFQSVDQATTFIGALASSGKASRVQSG